MIVPLVRSLCVGVVVLIATAAACGQVISPSSPTQNAAPSNGDRVSSDAKLEAMLQERSDTLQKGFEDGLAQYQSGRATLDFMLRVHSDWRAAQLELAKTPGERAAVHAEAVKTLAQMEKVVARKHEIRAPGGSAAEYAIVKAARIGAEISLMREQRKGK